LSIILALLIFSLVVTVHELGHFLLAKKSGIGVTEFSIGMGPRVLSTVKGETRYSLKLIPFGGSCMMVGEDEDNTEQNSFRSKSVSARISVILAGPIFNFILAYILAVVIIGMVGYDKPVVTFVEDNSNAMLSGLQEGDIIKELNGNKVVLSRDVDLMLLINKLQAGENTLVIQRNNQTFPLRFDTEITNELLLGIRHSGSSSQPGEILDIIEGGAAEAAGFIAGDVITMINGTNIDTAEGLSDYISQAVSLADNTMEITYMRGRKELTATVTPKITEIKSLGFSYGMREKANPLEVLRYSFSEVRFVVESTVQSLRMLITGQFGVDDLSGPVGIVNMVGDTYDKAKSDGIYYIIVNMLNLAILISANLGVMNLIPFPAIDGGRLIFLIIEAIRRKPIDANKEGIVHFAGLILLMALMIYVMFNDIIKLF